MGFKRLFDINDKRGRVCLKCGQQIPAEALKDDAIFSCDNCSQKHFVDFTEGGMCVLTLFERPDIRRRQKAKEKQAPPVPSPKDPDPVPETKKPKKADPKREEIKELKRRLKEAKARAEAAEKDVEEWKKAAEGLARMVEQYSEERRKLCAVLSGGKKDSGPVNA